MSESKPSPPLFSIGIYVCLKSDEKINGEIVTRILAQGPILDNYYGVDINGVMMLIREDKLNLYGH
jgi:hypothetical protein